MAVGRRRPAGMTINTDVGSPPPADGAGASTLRAWAGKRWAASSVCELLATPKNCLNSARRAVFTAPCEDDGERKMWMRLELRLGLQALVGGVGNGRLGWLIVALRRGIARTLVLEPALVDVREVYEARKGALTVVECVVSVPASRGRLDLEAAASDIMDQCERNRARVDDPADLMKLVSHVDVKDHGSTRLKWGLAQALLVAAIVAAFAHYYGAFAFGAGAPALGLRAGGQASIGLRGNAATARAANPTHLAQVPRARGAHGSALQVSMLDPMTISAVVLGCVDSVSTEKPTSRRTSAMARRACKSASTTCQTFAADPVLGTRTMVRTLASQVLLSADEDERPVRRTLMEDASEQAVDALDKVAMHASAHVATIQKAANIAIKAGHALDAFALQHPAAMGIASVAIIAGVAVAGAAGAHLGSAHPK